MNKARASDCLTHLQSALKVSALYPEGHPGIRNPLQNFIRELSQLLQAANKLPELTSVVIACLGEARSPTAVQALAQILDTNSRYSEDEQREAIRSLGRIRNPEALAPLKQVLGRKTFLRRRRTRALRIAAARAIGRIGGDDASMALAEHAVGPDPAVRKACQESLKRMSRAETR